MCPKISVIMAIINNTWYSCIHNYDWLCHLVTFWCYHYNLKNFTWADQRAKMCFIFHKAQLRCQECFIKQEQCFMKLQSLIKYSYAECSHFCEQHHLEFSPFVNNSTCNWIITVTVSRVLY